MPHEVTAKIFQQLEPYHLGTLALVCKAWNEIITNEFFHENLKKDYTLHSSSGLNKCRVIDYTGAMQVLDRTKKMSTKGIYLGFVDRMMPTMTISLKFGPFDLSNERRYLQPCYELNNDKFNSFILSQTSHITIRPYGGNSIEIHVLDAKGGDYHYYIDTPQTYSLYYHAIKFVYRFKPWTKIPLDKVERLVDQYLETVSFSEYRVIYNRFGVVIEGYNEKEQLEIYLLRPEDESFQKIVLYAPHFISNPKLYFLVFFKKITREEKSTDQPINKKLRITENQILSCYGGKDGFPLVSNYLSKDSEHIKPFLDGQEAIVHKQTDGFHPPHMNEWSV